jgi:hypothetical protein
MLEKLMGKQADDTFNEPFQPNEILKAVKHLKTVLFKLRNFKILAYKTLLNNFPRLEVSQIPL